MEDTGIFPPDFFTSFFSTSKMEQSPNPFCRFNSTLRNTYCDCNKEYEFLGS